MLRREFGIAAEKRTSFLALPLTDLLGTGLVVMTLADGETFSKALDVTADIGVS